MTRHLTIQGKVQGVWYRGWAVETARSLELTGWVRNRIDGTVEVLVTGADEAIGRFVTLAHDGPRAARVDRIELAEAEDEEFIGFEQRATV